MYLKQATDQSEQLPNQIKAILDKTHKDLSDLLTIKNEKPVPDEHKYSNKTSSQATDEIGHEKAQVKQQF